MDTARYALYSSRPDDELRSAICAWLTANGIDPDKVPFQSTITVADGQITYEEYLFHNNGLGRFHNGDLGRRSVTVPLREPMPPELDTRPDWRLPARLCDRCKAEAQ